MAYTKKVTQKKKPSTKHKKRVKTITIKKRKYTRRTTPIPETAMAPVIVYKLPRKKRTQNITRMYFTQDTEDAVIAYNNETDMAIRGKLFEERILHPFQKLIENIFNTFKFTYFKTSSQDVQKECLSHLVANIHKFDPTRTCKNDPTKKAKAYSYFSIVAKHFFILLNNNNWREFNQNVGIGDDKEDQVVQLQQEDKYYASQELKDFIRLMIEFWDKNITLIFSKERDVSIANAVVELFRNSSNIDYYNKKALYLYIREMSRCKTQQITKVISKMTTYQTELQRDYLRDGIIDMEKYVSA